MKKELFADEYFNIWILLSHVRKAIFRAQEKELLRHDITPEQAEALFCIQVIGDNVTPTALSRCIIREPHTTAGLVRRMEEKDLLRRTKDLPRKNMVRVELTEKGKQAYKISSRRESMHKIMSCLSARELRQLRKILEKLRDNAFSELGISGEALWPPPLVKMIS